MHPALSVILFTTLSGAGYGLLAWSAAAALWRWSDAGTLMRCLLLALVLVTVGLLSSMAHLGQPQRAWRAFSQWRSSWLSREGVLALLTYVPALALLALAWLEWLDPESSVFAHRPPWPVVAACVATVIGALATVVCTAMIYASLKPIPAWQHRLVVPGYLLFALLTGALLFVAGNGGTPRPLLPLLGLLALGAALLKQAYWRDIDSAPLPATRGDAIGLPGRVVSVFERPHTDGNYLTREMGFVLARKHAHKLRRIALLLFAAVPMLAIAAAWLWPTLAPWALVLATAASLLGAFVERWLFFAQARHLVTLYY